MSNHDFKSRKLYDQKCRIDEEKTVMSRVYATSYVYPGAITSTTARCRITLVYEHTQTELLISGGTIEKWSDKGWQVIEEYFDTCVILEDEEKAFEYLLSLYKAFTLGLPIEYRPVSSPTPPDPPPSKEPKLRVLSFKDKFGKQKSDQKVKQPKDKQSPDDNDFDWI